ncbi:Por secretion system C-terminal sorting domain-containing protein [Dyadobacter sp. SG02]|uniref:T9SS type A sorting domain-containing protein n=1 Tax=Dyadobacter sp. SG02 TaxID=1855291 RepID=UPI0008B3A14B|nr:T9SS type A sorting domain-containing protein [Dyadobacter sp. SG02]SEJ49728.1 Por secretion system C-terminal sorting domain-containing protein [Dyadobacter sp. SG02]
MYKLLLPLFFVCSVSSTLFAQKTWTGGSSSSWMDDDNWEPYGIPAYDDEITILANRPNSPVVPTGSEIEFHTIKVKPGASLTVEAGATMTSTASQNHTLEILGTFTNHGTVTITNNEVGPVEYAAIEINGGGVLRNDGTLTETGTISMGIFVVAGKVYNESGGFISVNNNIGLLLFSEGLLKNYSGAEIRIKGTAGSLGSLGDVTNSGKFTCEGNMEIGDGMVSNAPCGTFHVNGSVIIDNTSNRGMGNEGVVIITDTLKLKKGQYGNLGITKYKGIYVNDQSAFVNLFNDAQMTGSAVVADDPELLITGYGSASGMEVLGIFIDPAGTQSAGYYNGTYFSGDPSLPEGSQTLYIQMVINHASCVYTVPFTYVKPAPAGTWLGMHDSDWSNPINWMYNKVPDATTNVNIPAGTPNNPVISSDHATANDLTIAAGASLTLTEGAVLVIMGNGTNNGTFDAGAAFVAFTSTSPQTILGGQYAVLSVAGDSRKQLSGDATVNSRILLNEATKIALGDNDITLADNALIEGASAESYLITDGTGGLKKQKVGLEEFTFPVGSETSYTPLIMTNFGIVDNFTARANIGTYTSFLNNIPQGSPISSMAVNKTWYVSEDVPGGSNVTMTLFWNATDELPNFDRNECFITHYQNNQWDEMMALPAFGTGPYTKKRVGITSFSPFAVANPNSPLPVALARFDAVREGNAALLTWSTNSEINSDHFEVQRSGNAKDWESIGSVAAARESQVLTDYHFVDLHPLVLQESFYRLRMVDTDGTFAYSRIRNLSFSGSGKSLAYPNPATEKLFVQDFSQVSSACITDMSGKVVYRTSKVSDAGIQVDNLPAGLYLMEISWANGLRAVQKVLIDR